MGGLTLKEIAKMMDGITPLGELVYDVPPGYFDSWRFRPEDYEGDREGDA